MLEDPIQSQAYCIVLNWNPKRCTVLTKSVPSPTSHLPIVWLNSVALRNMELWHKERNKKLYVRWFNQVISALYGFELESKAVFRTYNINTARHVPGTDIFIECWSRLEEARKYCDLANIPVTNIFTVEKVSIEKKMSICRCVCSYTCEKSTLYDKGFGILSGCAKINEGDLFGG